MSKHRRLVVTKRTAARRAAATVALSVTVLGSGAALAPLAGAQTGEPAPPETSAPETTSSVAETTAAETTAAETTAAETTAAEAPAPETTTAPETSAAETTAPGTTTTVPTTTVEESAVAAEEPVPDFGTGKLRVGAVSAQDGEAALGARLLLENLDNGESVECVVTADACVPQDDEGYDALGTESIFGPGSYGVPAGHTVRVTQLAAGPGYLLPDEAVQVVPPCEVPPGVPFGFCFPESAIFENSTADARTVAVQLTSSVDGTALQGGEFVLSDPTVEEEPLPEEEVGVEAVLATATTGPDGSLLFDATVEPGTYTVEQTAAAPGYLPTEEPRTLVVEDTTPPVEEEPEPELRALKAAETVTLAFTNAADVPAPVGVDDAVSVPAGGSVVVAVLANDDGSGTDPLLGQVVTAPARGTARPAVDPACGTDPTACEDVVVYTPEAGFSGTDTFTYSVRTRGGSDTATVTVTVLAAAVVPVDPAVVPGATVVPVAQARTVPAASGLARTGVEVLPVLGTALALLGAGSALVAGSRSRRRDGTAAL